MSPTVRHDPLPADLDALTAAEPGRARAYAVALLTVALALTGALLARGDALPAPGLLLVFAIPLTLCMNRYLVFPNEVGVTADAAVIFAAMVAFRADAPWLGPLVLALLTGPLDARHWGARSFTRMAYNSASTALVTAVGLAVYVPSTAPLGTGWEATLAAALLAAVPYCAAESVLGIALVWLLGEHPVDALRQQLPLNALVLPLALLGAAAGLAAVGVGGWCALLLLLPAAFLPEVVFLVIARRVPVALRWLTACGLALAWSVVGSSSAVRTAAGLVALVLLVVADHRPRTPGDGPRLPPSLALVATAVGVYAASGAVGPVAVIALGIAVGAGAATLLTRSVIRAAWTVPVLVTTAGAASLAHASGRLAAVVLVAVVAGALGMATTFGPPPWPSRLLTGTVPDRVGFLAVAALAVAAALTTLLTTGTARDHLAVLGVTALAALVVAAACAVRMWRFAPRRRRLDAALVAAVTLGAVVLVLPLATHGSWFAPLLVLAGAVLTHRLTRVAPRDTTATPGS